MALSQLYSAIPGDIITAARWNNEFGNLYNNGTDVSFPVTKNVSFAGFTLTLDASGVTTLLSPANSGFAFNVGAKSGTPGANGALGFFAASTFTDTNTAIAGTAALYSGLSIRTPTLAASNAGVITTLAATLYIEGAPAAGTNETITNACALYANGKTQVAGALQVDGATNIGGALTVTGSFIAPSLDPYLLTNLRITATLAGNAMTLALKTDANVDPSSSDKIRIRFRNGTLATGGTTEVDISSALSVVVSSGSTLGTVNGQANRIYVGLLNNGGVAELFVYNPLSGTNLRGLIESTLLTTTSEGGAGGADSAQVAYSTTGRATKAFRIIGFVESTQATAGTWVTAISTIQELQPWMPRTGFIIGTAYATNGVSSGQSATSIPNDDTIPQVGEGNQVVQVSYTPSNPANVIDIEAKIAGVQSTLGTSASVNNVIALFTDLSANALTADNPLVTSGTGTRGMGFLKWRSVSLGAMTSAQVRHGVDVTGGGSGAGAFNGNTTNFDFAATMNSYISVTEIMV